ncbi:MAG: hypothetical protein H6Q26_1876, partial [Bacteroidetes bacterium]|nr:hypothetical protein [Bacteroidota bacterium]
TGNSCLKSSYFFLGLKARVKTKERTSATVMTGGILAQVSGGSAIHL